MANFSIEELTVIEASRYINDGETVFAGTGLPLMATMLAQKTHAPHLCFVAETGPIAPIVLPTPLSVSDPRLQYQAVRLGSSAGSPGLPVAARHDGCRFCRRRRNR